MIFYLLLIEKGIAFFTDRWRKLFAFTKKNRYSLARVYISSKKPCKHSKKNWSCCATHPYVQLNLMPQCSGFSRNLFHQNETLYMPSSNGVFWKKSPRNLKLIINKIKFWTVDSLFVCLFYFLIEKGATAKGAYARWKASESSDAFWKGFVVLYIKEYILEIVVYFSIY